MMPHTLADQVTHYRDDITTWRRHLHRHPELSFKESRTADYIEEVLRSFGNLELSRPTPTSVMARLIGDLPGKTLALRADTDALPIQEENDFEFASCEPGVMHACGHDGHTAMLLGAARILSQHRERLQGEIRFFFQHAEEYFPGGAKEMVEAGAMEGVDWVMGAHLMSDVETGKIGVRNGPMMAAPDGFFITIQGKGGHGAMPHQARDSIAIGAEVVSNLHQLVARHTNPLEPLVVTVGKFVAGEAPNVIADKAELAGTVRSFDPEVRAQVPILMERIVKGITEAHGANYRFEYLSGYHPVINDEAPTQLVREAAIEAFGEAAVIDTPPKMGAEDFSAFLQEAPGSYFFIGSGNAQKGSDFPHHHPRFTIDEDALLIGTRLFCEVALRYCA
ncbi:M20 family metallopeptidase [Halomonas sp. HK25]|uniref:M20 family metallopeptidase n=1 Tax=Halomonas sp. HK25 TaxID=3394321 RepID=UPI0039FB9858